MQKANPLDWLLEEDKENPSVRYFALRELLDRPESDVQVRVTSRHRIQFALAPNRVAVTLPNTGPLSGLC
jgi:hypothetical protein